MKLRNKKTGEIIRFYDGITLNGEDYDSLAELNEEWEDYKPAEPLIKDEMIKKALGEIVELELVVNELNKRFNKFNKLYKELCGEEEE